MARSDVNVVCQIGVETTPGTNVTAGKKLTSLGFEFGRELSTRFYRQPGVKYVQTGVRHRRWSTGTFSGVLDYNHIQYVLAGLFGHGTVTTVDTNGKSWPISPNASSADSTKHYTMQQGDSTAAEEIAYGTFLSLNINFASDSIDVSGDIIGQAVDDTVTLDTVSSTIAEAPVSVADVDWYFDSTYGGIGTTKLTDVMEATLSIPNKLQPKFVMNTSYPAWRELVEGALEDARLTLVLENIAQTRALLTAMDTDSLPVRYFQCKALGNIIGATTQQEQFKGNFACKLDASPRPRRNVMGTYAYEVPLRIVNDATMGRPMEYTVINTIPAL